MAMAEGSLIGLGCFCVVELLPSAINALRRRRVASQRSQRAGNRPAPPAATSVLDRCRASARASARWARRDYELPLRDVLVDEDLSRAVARFLCMSEACLLKGASCQIRSASWGRGLRPHICLFGGRTPAAKQALSCERLAIGDASWQASEAAWQGRVWASGAVMGGLLYVCGGSPGQGRAVDAYDPDLGQWSAQPPLLEQRIWPACAVVLGYLYVCGGKIGEEVSNTAECFAPHVGEWERARPMAEERYGASCAVVSECLYVCGGSNAAFSNADGRPLQSAECLDHGLDEWTEAPEMLEARCWAVSAVNAGRIYVCGGRTGPTALCSVERWKPGDEAWERVREMGLGRFGAVATAFAGRIYVVGGCDCSTTLSSVEVYDEEEDAWVEGPCLSESRSWAVAALMVCRTP